VVEFRSRKTGSVGVLTIKYMLYTIETAGRYRGGLDQRPKPFNPVTLPPEHEDS
jgi:hypothetical protein